jgi:hypothetical protein
MLPNYYYLSNHSVVQNADHVMIVTEMVHDLRITRLGEPAPLPNDMRPWFGDSWGVWEGDRLVVETISVSSSQRPLASTRLQNVSTTRVHSSRRQSTGVDYLSRRKWSALSEKRRKPCAINHLAESSRSGSSPSLETTLESKWVPSIKASTASHLMPAVGLIQATRRVGETGVDAGTLQRRLRWLVRTF